MNFERYIGTSVVEAAPATLGEYAEYAGKRLKKTDPADKAGYIVRYEDGSEVWLPADVFEKQYQVFYDLTFGKAMELLRKGYCLARASWYESAPQRSIQIVTCIGYETIKGEVVPLDPSSTVNTLVVLVDSDGVHMVGWIPTQADMLASDWYVSRSI